MDNDVNRGGTADTLRGLELIRSNQNSVGVIKVLNSVDFDGLYKDYLFLKDKKINLKLSPLFSCGNVSDVSDYIDTEGLTQNLIRLLSVWMDDEDSPIVVEPLESMLKAYFGSPRRECNMGSCLGGFLCITPEGNFYPCSRFYPQDYMLGNIEEFSSINEIFETEKYKKMVLGAIARRNKCKENCEFFGVCQGGCNNVSIMMGDITSPDKSICARTKAVFSYISQNVRDLDSIKNKALKERIRKACSI